MATLTKVKPKLATTVHAASAQIESANLKPHRFLVKLTEDFGNDQFYVSAPDSATAQQEGINEFLRRNGVAPVSLESLTQLT